MATAAARERIERSPADLLRLVVAGLVLLALLVVEGLFGETLTAFAGDLLRGLDAIPQWIVDSIVLGTRILAVVVLGGGLVLTLLRGRWRMLATVSVAGLLAGLLFWLVDGVFDIEPGAPPVGVGVDAGALSDGGFPTAAGLAVITAVLTAAAPWLSRRWRRAGWALVLGLVVTRVVLSPLSFDSLQAAVIGWFVGSGALVLLGAPSRRPTAAAVGDGLARVGLELASLHPAGVDARGSTPYFGSTANGGAVFVKALGADERSADLLFRLYRRIQPRQFGDERPFSSLRRGVEHEALVALAAHTCDVRTPALLAFATAEPNGYVLAYEAIPGRSLDRLEPSQVTDDVLDGIWDLIARMHRHRIAHRDLRLANIFLDDARGVWLIDFGFSEMAATDLLLATDVAEALASSTLYVGVDRALRPVITRVDRATLARAGDRLRPWALSGATRAAYKARPGLLADVRTRLAAGPRPVAPPTPTAEAAPVPPAAGRPARDR